MNMDLVKVGLITRILAIALLSMTTEARVVVDLSINSYSNVNGTAYVDTSTSRKCCDGPQRASCQTGDTCDTYFDICIGSIKGSWGCQGKGCQGGGCHGAAFHTKPQINSNHFNNLSVLEQSTDVWNVGALVFVFVRDDDTVGSIKHNDHIDTLIDPVTFTPAASRDTAVWNNFGWEGKTSLNLSVLAWCADNYYGQYCGVYCQGIPPMATCEGSTGHLSCQSSGELILEFLATTTEHDFPKLDVGLNMFMSEQVCNVNTSPHIYYPKQDTNTNTLSFSAYCGAHQLTAMEFESILLFKTNVTLSGYFSPGVVRGRAVTPRTYGENIKPNVYVGVEVLSVDHPLGTSYSGENILGGRQCCDVPQTNQCTTVADKCDLQFSICVGELVHGKCIGAVTISTVFKNTTSLSTCGPTLLDYTKGQAYPAHPMIGAMRLIKNTSSIQVLVKDSDLNGQSFDIIDVLTTNITVLPSDNITMATNVDVNLKNIVNLKLRFLFWCAPGHSGPLCHADNGTDQCNTGWQGDECNIPIDACDPNPCKHNSKCNLNGDGTFNCTCQAGYTGRTCANDINECFLHVCSNGATCVNLDGAFTCNCAEGWRGLICTEQIPQCNPSPCTHGTCSPKPKTISDYVCNCSQGWQGRNCSEIDTCTTTSCVHGQCTSSSENVFCICHRGYTGDNCTDDIDECQAKPCQNGGTCSNTVGSFNCACLPGFSGELCQNSLKNCEHVVCQNNGTCTSDSGKYTNQSCACQDGYTGAHCETKIDYCQNIACDNFGVCYETNLDWQCNCTKYFSGKTCDVDVNECIKSVCVHSSGCMNLPGSYNCQCLPGWTGQNCDTDINECAMPQCKHGDCTNTVGSYNCECAFGYTGPHCLMSLNYCINVTCSNHGTCQELVNGHSCKCNPGFTGNDCESDTNECDMNVCGAHSVNCTNLNGSYNCTCASGWQGSTCARDINECSVTNPIPCNGNGLCSNTQGGYKCTCFPGFTGNDCQVFYEDCTVLKCFNGATCVMANDGPKCNCSSGWSGIKCETDVDECENIPCNTANGVCQNTPGSYYCRCYPGWTGSTCTTDVNECLSSICKNNGSCTNTQGGYDCACKTGWNGMGCEVLMSSVSGSLYVIQFKYNITGQLRHSVVSYLYKFLQKDVCNGTDTQLAVQSIVNNGLRFSVTCQGNAVSLSQINNAIGSVPNNTRPYLFPLPLKNVQQAPVDPTSQKSWLSDNWAVVVGCVTAAVIIAIAVPTGCYFHKRRRQNKENENFSNPAFTADF